MLTLLVANMPYVLAALFWLGYQNILCAILRKKSSSQGFRLPAINCRAFSMLGIQIKDLITGGSNPYN